MTVTLIENIATGQSDKWRTFCVTAAWIQLVGNKPTQVCFQRL